MYKKVSHTIVEEHFNNPTMAAQANDDALDNYHFSGLKQIEKDSIIGWAALMWRIRSLVISITSGDEDIDLLELRMASDIDNIAGLLTSAYGDEVVKRFAELLNTLMLSLVGVITDIKAGTDTTTSMSKLSDDTSALAEFLASLSTDWSVMQLTEIFTRMENLYMDQTRARIKHEWAAGVAAADRAYNMMVAKSEDNGRSFADIFSYGIINANLFANLF